MKSLVKTSHTVVSPHLRSHWLQFQTPTVSSQIRTFVGGPLQERPQSLNFYHDVLLLSPYFMSGNCSKSLHFVYPSKFIVSMYNRRKHGL